jgi:hypothetical protein
MIDGKPNFSGMAYSKAAGLEVFSMKQIEETHPFRESPISYYSRIKRVPGFENVKKPWTAFLHDGTNCSRLINQLFLN